MTNDTNHTAPIINEDWAGEMGARWLANLQGFEGTIATVGDALLEHANFSAGENVLDVGCGGGATTLAIARSVAPGGRVLGVDISPDLIAATTRRAAAAGLANAQFLCVDAATVNLPNEPFDRLCSRFGCMFFSDPVAAFSNLRNALKQGGRIDLAVWAAPQDNPWMSAGVDITRRYVDLPPAVPRAPGPFAFAEPDYIINVLESSGFGNVDVSSTAGFLPVGGANSTPEGALAFAKNALASWQTVMAQNDEIQRDVSTEFLALYERHHRNGEGVMMGFKAWLITAWA